MRKLKVTKKNLFEIKAKERKSFYVNFFSSSISFHRLRLRRHRVFFYLICFIEIEKTILVLLNQKLGILFAWDQMSMALLKISNQILCCFLFSRHYPLFANQVRVDVVCSPKAKIKTCNLCHILSASYVNIYTPI
jgi:hypothetical protein